MARLRQAQILPLRHRLNVLFQLLDHLEVLSSDQGLLEILAFVDDDLTELGHLFASDRCVHSLVRLEELQLGSLNHVPLEHPLVVPNGEVSLMGIV